MISSWKEVNAEKYLAIMDLHGDLHKTFKIIYGKDLSSIPIGDITSGKFDWIKNEPKTVDIRFVWIQGKRFGMVNFDDMSMGEFIDLSMFSEDWKKNIWEIMAICYRPVTGLSVKNKWKEFWGKVIWIAGHRLSRQDLKDRGVKLMTNLDYKVEKYDAKTHLQNAKHFKQLSSEVLNSFLLFFSALSILRMGNTLKSLAEEIRPKKKRSPKKG